MEVSTGRLAIADEPDKVHRNPFGVIPKPKQPGKFCLIVDLTAPQKASVNDGTDAMLCSLEYTSVEQAAKLVKCLGSASLWALLCP